MNEDIIGVFPEPKDAIGIVIGNSASDLDSIVCSVAYSYLLNKLGENVVPVLSISKADLLLRTEVTFLFKTLAFNWENLVFSDDSRVGDLQKKSIKLHLVDHNKHENSVLSLQEFNLETIVDHHEDEGSSCRGRKCIKMVGSCASLITLLFKDAIEVNPLFEFPQCLKKMLSATIVLDTINLDSMKGRVTPFDVEMLEYLAVPQHEAISFESLMTAKTDISCLSVYDLLRRDSKSYNSAHGKVCVSSITGADWSVFAGKSNILEDTERYVATQNISFLVIMLAYHGPDNNFKRFIVFAHGKHLVTESPLKNMVNELKLNVISQCIVEKWSVFEQLEVKSSRKVVLPLLKSVIPPLL